MEGIEVHRLYSPNPMIYCVTTIYSHEPSIYWHTSLNSPLAPRNVCSDSTEYANIPFESLEFLHLTAPLRSCKRSPLH